MHNSQCMHNLQHPAMHMYTTDSTALTAQHSSSVVTGGRAALGAQVVGGGRTVVSGEQSSCLITTQHTITSQHSTAVTGAM